MQNGGLRTKGITKKTTDSKPLITVVTVVYNGKATLEETIQSVLNQKYDNVEYVIIDGGSTDGTLEIIQKCEDKIDYWQSEPDKGIYDAMNKGIGAATGEWINFMNSGDIFFDETVIDEVFKKNGMKLTLYTEILSQNLKLRCNIYLQKTLLKILLVTQFTDMDPLLFD